MLRQVLASEQCAKCRLCCSFTEEDAWEAPTLTNPLTGEKYRAEYKFKDKKEILLCPALDEKKGCTLGADKPFECAIWPLRPFIIDGRVRIGISGLCPAFSEETDGKLVGLLRDGLYEKIAEEVKKNPELTRENDGSYRIIY